MTYNVYVNGKRKGTTKDNIDCVMRCNAYAKAGHPDVSATEVMLDGTETPYDWYKDYLDLCYGAY